MFRARGFEVTRLRTAFRFDDEAEGRRLLGCWFGDEVAAGFEGTTLDHQVYVYTSEVS